MNLVCHALSSRLSAVRCAALGVATAALVIAPSVPASSAAASQERPPVSKEHSRETDDGSRPSSVTPETLAKIEQPTARVGLWDRPVRRGGFHFQLGFGLGGGPDSAGLFHTMEVGYTFRQELTIAVLHTFIQNKGFLGGTYGGPDLFGGWLLEAKYPLFFPDLVGKVALGLGGIHEQPTGGPLKAHGGFGASYGVDLHLPVWPRFGPTLTLAAIHATALGNHHFGVALGLGVTLF